MSAFRPLRGWRVVSTALNVPGPVAMERLASWGAAVLKIEPQAGDPLARYCRAWYDALHTGVDVERLDLKAPEGRAKLDQILSSADILVTAQRPAALARLSLNWERLRARFPRLCHVAIVGCAPPHDDRAGHDLTHAASEGLVHPPDLPRTLFVDLAGAERVVGAVLAARIACTGLEATGQRVEVALEDVAQGLSAPLRHRLTVTGGILGGGFPGYRIYRSRDGWVAVAALEPQFFERLCRELQATESRPSTEPPPPVQSRAAVDPRDDPFAAMFAVRTAAEWENWGLEYDVPIVAVREPVP